MKDLKIANHLLGDRQALDAAWERHGYWFFRDVLPGRLEGGGHSSVIVASEHGRAVAVRPQH